MDEELAQQYGYRDSYAAGGLLFCSGQLGVDTDGHVPKDPARQFELAFAALETLLARHGLGPADIVDLTSFHVHYPLHMEAFMRSKAAFMGGATCCWTAVGVTALGYPDALAEIKTIARLGNNAG
ncbi:MAG: RidA family protein [Rhodanobacter sp.]|nr:MAG: RidA family protein [Rhodanobacter sp.]TAM07930.1 MAG: RidA family protein [Rhodanobacter sp.]TAM37574.1 MAG: RidA family protein [Rhodanobacter sp.]